MSTVNEPVSAWLNKQIQMALHAPEDYASHGRRGRQPYMHIVNHEVKQMHKQNVENPKRENLNMYSMIMLDISSVKSYYEVLFPSFKRNYILRDDELEHSYDWIINEAISAMLCSQGQKVDKHVRHDVYKCIYDEIGSLVQKNIREIIDQQGYGFIIGSKVKTMVCGPNLILARSSNG